MSATTNQHLPEITITTSSPASQSLDALLSQEHDFLDDARSVRSLPPAYNETHGREETAQPAAMTATAVPAPIPAHLPPSTPRIPFADLLPTYAYATVDMPPSYPKKKKCCADEDDLEGLNPIEPQEPWPLTKKLYVAGFLIWPLWFIGMGFSIFGKSRETRRWGRRCAWNALVVAAIFTYLVVAIVKTTRS